MSVDRGHFTRKQLELLELIHKGDGSGDFLDNDQLVDLVSYTRSKQAVQCSIRFLESRGLVERDYEVRRGRRRVIYKLSAQGMATFDAGTGLFDVVVEGLDDLDLEM